MFGTFISFFKMCHEGLNNVYTNCLIQYTFYVYYTYFVFESHIFLICYVINKTTNGTLGKWTRLRGVWLME